MKWQPPRPSVFTPFLRRFTDERAQDIGDTRKLYARVTERHRATIWAEAGTPYNLAGVIMNDAGIPIPRLIKTEVRNCLAAMLSLEKPIFSTPEIGDDIGNLSLKELVDLRRFLRSQEHFLDHEDRTLRVLCEPLTNIVMGVLAELPKLDAPSPFTIPLINLLPDPHDIVEKICGTLTDDAIFDCGLFTELNERRYRNMCELHGLQFGAEVRKALKHISEFGLSPSEALKAMLKGTPFFDFLMTPVPLKFDHETRFNHVHVVGGSGAGKTQLLQNLILHDLMSDNPPALIIVDSQSDLINKISRLELFHPEHGALKGKLTIITPREIDYPPAINIFDIDKNRLGRYTPALREQVVAGVIQTFDYLFAGLLGADLTAKQSVFFRFVARLMLALPETMGRNATILDMMNLMDDMNPYREAIKTLPPLQRNFFERDFQATNFRQTKEQIRYRLQAILENPTLERLFTSTRTKVDLFSEINTGGIILIDTAKDFLKDGSAHFGRIFISLVLQAALERAAIPERERRPAFLVVDEAADYFDDNIDDLLTQVRKYKLGCLFAHQFMDQCTSSLRASLAANTGTKLCAALSMADARSLAADMRTTPDFILRQKKLTFAGFVRNVTPEAVAIPAEAGRLERQQQLSADDYDDLRSANHWKVSAVLDPIAEPNAELDIRDGGTEAGQPDAALAPSPANSIQSPWVRGQPQPHQPAPKAPRPGKPQPDPNEPSTDW